MLFIGISRNRRRGTRSPEPRTASKTALNALTRMLATDVGSPGARPVAVTVGLPPISGIKLSEYEWSAAG
jgi:NAD(P)-dependent dehydrogenase (short-subunit alcohol dehydrogenase family)